jgi:hypothetical protein
MADDVAVVLRDPLCGSLRGPRYFHADHLSAEAKAEA